jgi:hypothetical protein
MPQMASKSVGPPVEILHRNCSNFCAGTRDSDKVDTLPGKVFSLGTIAVLTVSKVEVKTPELEAGHV